MLQLRIKKAKTITINGSHTNFIGTPLEGLDFNIVIGNGMGRTEYQKAIRSLSDEESSQDKIVFQLHIMSHDIVFVDEHETEITDFNETVERLYEDKNTVPVELFNTIYEELSTYLGIKTQEDEEKKSSIEPIQSGVQDTEVTV